MARKQEIDYYNNPVPRGAYYMEIIGSNIAYFDRNKRFIPTEFIPSYSKGENWDDSDLIRVSSYDFPDREEDREEREAEEEKRRKEEAEYQLSKAEAEQKALREKRNVYVSHRQAIRALPASLAAGGYSGGMGETATANLISAYENALTALERQKMGALAKLQIRYMDR